jgi:uncharacterized membrane protein
MSETVPAATLTGVSTTLRRLGPQRGTSGPGASDAAPSQWHRGMTLLAVISMFIGTRALWTKAMVVHPVLGGVISLCYAAILILGIFALVVRHRRALVRADFAVLLLALILTTCRYVLDHSNGDESVLAAQATHELLHGHLIYGQSWPWIFQQMHVGTTHTMAGGTDYSFGYPPLAVLLAAPVYAVIGTNAITLVTTTALLIGTIALWALLPTPWRSAATLACLGFPMLPLYAGQGYPAIIALVLLIPVVVRWTGTGAGGRLSRPDILRAVCLGAACAAQQLPWFLAPFLVAGIYAVRRGELPARAALAVVARYTGIAVLVWFAINAYFIAQSPRDWLSGILLPLTQHAVLHGQGVLGISYYFTNGSSRLDFYSYGSTLLLIGLLAVFVVFIRRLGPAATVLPWCAFYLATRSQDGYYLMMTPLWLAAAATVPSSVFASAWQPRLPFPRRRTANAALAAALLAPAAACVTVAAASSPPLRLTIESVQTNAQGITSVTLEAANTTGTTLTPNFAVSNGQGATGSWIIRTGPTVLRAHHSAHYDLTPNSRVFKLPKSHAHLRIRLRVFTDAPMTVSSADLPLPKTGAKTAARTGLG